MNPQARYQDQHWQLERRLADLHSERQVLTHEIQQRHNQIEQLEKEMVHLQDELLNYHVGEPS